MQTVETTKLKRGRLGVNYDYKKIECDFRKGKTLNEIGDEYGVTRERIRQILRSLDIKSCDGGVSVRGDINKRIKMKLQAISHHNRALRWGFSKFEELIAHVTEYGNSTDPTSPMRRYLDFKNHSRKYSHAFNVTFAEWWCVWKSSGKWHLRGKGKYGMRLIDVSKSYQKDNLEIYSISGSERRSHVLGVFGQRKAANS
jgi:hypothetical protein